MSPESKKQNGLMNILWFMLSISISLNIILFIKRSESFPAKRELISANQDLNKKVNQYKNDLNKFRGISNKIDQVVQDAQLKIEASERQLAAARKMSSSARKEQEKERSLLLHELDSIQNLYVNVIDSLLVEREAKKAINQKIENLEDIIAGLNTRLGNASMLMADNLTAKPLKKIISGNKQPTAIAKRVNAIELQFDLLANRTSLPGMKNIYIVFTSPEAVVVADQRTGLIEFNHPEYKKTALCSIHESINYNNEKTLFRTQFLPDSELRPGLYIAEVFTGENKLGMITFSLK